MLDYCIEKIVIKVERCTFLLTSYYLLMLKMLLVGVCHPICYNWCQLDIAFKTWSWISSNFRYHFHQKCLVFNFCLFLVHLCTLPPLDIYVRQFQYIMNLQKRLTINKCVTLLFLKGIVGIHYFTIKK